MDSREALAKALEVEPENPKLREAMAVVLTDLGTAAKARGKGRLLVRNWEWLHGSKTNARIWLRKWEYCVAAKVGGIVELPCEIWI